jgi:hypothetical protein
MSGRRISVIVLRAPGNDIDTLKQMTAAAVRALNTIASGENVELEHSATGEN